MDSSLCGDRDKALSSAQLVGAKKKYRALLEKNPKNVACLHLLGLIEQQSGKTDLAAQWFEKALTITPDSAELNYKYAQTLAVQKKYAEALRAYKRCLALKPDYPEAYYGLGLVFEETGREAEALEAYHCALAENPNHPTVLNRVGMILTKQGALMEAADCYERAITEKPDFYMGLNNLGAIYYQVGKVEQAAEYFNRALAIKPEFPNALNNIGMVLRYRGEFEKSIQFFNQALSLQPGYPEAFNNLGNALRDTGRLSEAIAAYKQALVLKKDYADCQHNFALALLAAGRLEEGWRRYDQWRWKSTQFAGVRHGSGQPKWRGEVGEGRVLLIDAEQGLGDTLQFCRYAPLATACGLRVILQVQEPLVGLLQSLPNVEQIIAQGPLFPEHDLYCPMLSLPHAFGTRLDTIPADVPYLKANPAKVEYWRTVLPDSTSYLLKVGLVWAGGQHKNSPLFAGLDRRRSINPNMLAPLMDIGGVQYYSLQKGGQPAPSQFGLIDTMDSCLDFADTAALIANLDLVIGVDTAVVHLAGALGKPVWLLNRFDSCWRWLQSRADSPWYPTLRLFRQPKPGDWQNVVSQVKNELRRLISRES